MNVKKLTDTNPIDGRKEDHHENQKECGI